MSQEVGLSIVGSGGDGAVAAGDIVAMACATAGLHVIKTDAYGPQIRGGESSCSVRVSATPIFAQAGSSTRWSSSVGLISRGLPANCRLAPIASSFTT